MMIIIFIFSKQIKQNMQFNWAESNVAFKVAAAPVKKTKVEGKRKAEQEKLETSTQASSKDSQSESGIEICRDFLRGKCWYGKDCWYSHAVKEFKAEQKANGACKHFFRDHKCVRGDACKYSHDAEWLAQQQEKNKGKNCYNIIRDGKCHAGDACFFNHVGVKKFAFAYAKLN